MPPVLVQISIPPRLREEMMLKEAFPVPRSDDGRAFVRWLEGSSAAERDDVMKVAYERDICIVDALREKLGGACE